MDVGLKHFYTKEMVIHCRSLLVHDGCGQLGKFVTYMRQQGLGLVLVPVALQCSSAWH